MSEDKIDTDMANPPRVTAPGGMAKDLNKEGLNVGKDTRTFLRTHSKASAVAAMTRASLRQAPSLVFRDGLVAGVPLPRRGWR